MRHLSNFPRCDKLIRVLFGWTTRDVVQWREQIPNSPKHEKRNLRRTSKCRVDRKKRSNLDPDTKIKSDFRHLNFNWSCNLFLFRCADMWTMVVMQLVFGNTGTFLLVSIESRTKEMAYSPCKKISSALVNLLSLDRRLLQCNYSKRFQNGFFSRPVLRWFVLRWFLARLVHSGGSAGTTPPWGTGTGPSGLI